MKLIVKSNGLPVEMDKKIFDELPEDQKRAYEVVDATDAKPSKKPDQAVTSEVPASGEKK